MRYFIKKYIQEKRGSNNDKILDQYKQKIKNVMFGPILVPVTWEQLFSTTLDDYEKQGNYEKIFPVLTGQALIEEKAKEADYETQYNAIFPDTAAAAAAPGGGARSKKTKRRKGVKGGRRSKTRKRRLTNKRRGNRRRNRTRH
jgi:hypothetical protein